MRTAVHVAALSVPMFLSNLAPLASAQAAPRESKAERLQQLRAVLAHEDQTIATLGSLKANTSGPHAAELESAVKARDAVQRLINQIDGAADDAGIAAAHKRDTTRERNAGATDYYAAIKQVRQQLEDDYGALEKDPGKNNPHLKNAMKYLGEAREPIAKEIADYERAHPAAVAAPAAPAPVAPAPAAPMPPVAAPSAAPTGPDQRIPELSDTISHLDHAIDYVTAEPTSDAMRPQTLAALVKARDAVRQLVDELSGKDASKDMQSDHARDAVPPHGKLPDYYSGLIQVEEYLQNDHIVLGREAEDAGHLHAAAVKTIEDAYGLVRKQIDAYHKANPGK